VKPPLPKKNPPQKTEPLTKLLKLNRQQDVCPRKVKTQAHWHHSTPKLPTPSAQPQQYSSAQQETVCDETPASPSGRKSPVLIRSPVVRRFNEILEAAKELIIELLNPSAEILETAFDVYMTENQIKAHSLDVLLRKTFYDYMSPMERADYVYTAACEELRSPEATPRASPAKKRQE
jgi:hypothetical protein